jgi:hypothetical protein
VTLTLDMEGYRSLPFDVRSRFDAWLEAEGLLDKRIVELTPGEGEVRVRQIARDAGGDVIVKRADGNVELVFEQATYAISTLPPLEVFAAVG